MLRLKQGNNRYFIFLTLVILLIRKPELLQGSRAECGMCGCQPQQAGMDPILENLPNFTC
jgi:hypothetical protein